VRRVPTLNAFSAAQTTRLTITEVFDAPSLNTTPAVIIAGPTTVSALLVGVVSSPESSLFGIAVTGLTGQGTWEYSFDGFATAGTAFNKPSASAALLLPDTASIRFTPAVNFRGRATLSYKAWDADHLPLSGPVNTTTAANKNYFSSTTETLSIFVGNNTPTLDTI
jgi:hypothetical protein